MEGRRTWKRDDFTDFAKWFAQWLNDGRACRCSIDRGESGLISIDELTPARARVQSSRRTLKDSPKLTELFVNWTGGPQVTVERKHFREASTDDDALVVVKLFAKPQITMRFYRR